jgi:hypothetical protein
MREVTLYAYDPQLRPGTIGADFETGDPNEAYTLRYEEDEAEKMGLDIIEWINGKVDTEAK